MKTLCLTLVAVLLAACAKTKPPETMIQGRPISEWVAQFSDADHDYVMNAVAAMYRVGRPINEPALPALRIVASDPKRPDILRGRAAILLASQFDEPPNSSQLNGLKLLFYGDEEARKQLVKIFPTMTSARPQVVEILQEFHSNFVYPRPLREDAGSALEQCGEEGKLAMAQDFEKYKENHRRGLE